MVQKSLFLAISGDGGSWRGLAFHKKWPERTGFCQNRPYCGRTKPRVRKQNKKNKNKETVKDKTIYRIILNKIRSIVLTRTSRLGGIGRVGSPAPMFIEQWYLLGKGHAMVEGGMVG